MRVVIKEGFYCKMSVVKMYTVQMKIILMLSIVYSDIVNSLIQPGEQIMQNDKKKCTHKPGWVEYVDNLYDTSREIRQMWINAGKPRQGPVHDLHVK